MTLHFNKAQIALLLIKEVKILAECFDFSDIFSEKKTSVLPELIKLNQNTIKVQDDKYPSYMPIYSQELVELKRLKT